MDPYELPVNIVNAVPSHVAPLLDQARAEDQKAFSFCAQTPEEVVMASLAESIIAKTALLDNRPVAMWGVCQKFMLDAPLVWLVGTPAIKQYKMKFLRISAHEVREFRARFGRLQAFCDKDFIKSRQWLSWLGFTPKGLVDNCGLWTVHYKMETD